jgi:sugar phosphate isomerase/epimerase
LLDIWHVFRSGTDYETMAEIVPAASLFSVELSDAVSRVQGTLREDTVHNRLLCGEGEADVPGFIRAIDRIGYDGPWGVEIISDAHRALPVSEALRRAFATTENCFRSA